MKGYKHTKPRTDEHKRKIGEANKGKICSLEHRRKLSEATKGIKKANSGSFKKGHGLGESNINWNGGISLNKRRLNEPRYIKWRKKVF